MARTDRLESFGIGGANKSTNGGPKLSEYGRRYYSDSLTKQEVNDLHKYRMKNDPEYKEKIKIERLRKKDVVAKKSTPVKTKTSKKPTGG